MRAGPDPHLHVEVVAADGRGVVARSLRLPAGAVVADALERAAEDPRFEALVRAAAALGVFGRVVSPEEPLADGDRVELYRPLAADPKSARRARARTQAAGRRLPGGGTQR